MQRCRKIFLTNLKSRNIAFHNQKNPIDYVENKSITSTLPDGGYFFIKNFTDTSEMVKAINNGISHQEEVQSIKEIKAIFTGYTNKGKNYILIQEFNQRTSGSVKKFRFGFSKNTFSPIDCDVISLDLKLTAIFISDGTNGFGELKFKSFAGVCRIFDMEEYKHSASDQEVQDFLSHPLLDFAEFEKGQQNLLPEYQNSIQNFIKSKSAKKIGDIMQSRILNNVTIENLYAGIKEVGINVNIENNKIIVPSGAVEFEKFLKCLSEDLYSGPFTKDIFEVYSRSKFKKIGK
jgi:hypothetical protein